MSIDWLPKARCHVIEVCQQADREGYLEIRGVREDAFMAELPEQQWDEDDIHTVISDLIEAAVLSRVQKPSGGVLHRGAQWHRLLAIMVERGWEC